MITEEWLRKVDKEFDIKDIPFQSRVFLAIHKGYEEKLIPNRTIVGGLYGLFNSDKALSVNPDVEYIETWYSQRVPNDASLAVEIMPCVFFYKQTFWKLNFPIVYGRCKLDPVKCLRNMPDEVKKDLLEEPGDFIKWWKTAGEYAYGMQGFGVKEKNPYGLQLLSAGNQRICAIGALLQKEGHLNSGGNLICRDAVEIFLKSYLVFKGKIQNDSEASKKYSHAISKALRDCISVSNNQALWKSFESRLSLLPKVSGRYEEQQTVASILWDNYTLAVAIGAEILREVFQTRCFEEPRFTQVTRKP